MQWIQDVIKNLNCVRLVSYITLCMHVIAFAYTVQLEMIGIKFDKTVSKLHYINMKNFTLTKLQHLKTHSIQKINIDVY